MPPRLRRLLLLLLLHHLLGLLLGQSPKEVGGFVSSDDAPSRSMAIHRFCLGLRLLLWLLRYRFLVTGRSPSFLLALIVTEVVLHELSSARALLVWSRGYVGDSSTALSVEPSEVVFLLFGRVGARAVNIDIAAAIVRLLGLLFILRRHCLCHNQRLPF